MQPSSENDNNTGGQPKENGIRLTEVTANWENGPLAIGLGAGYVDRQESQKPVGLFAFMQPKSTYQIVAAYDFGFVKVSGLAAQNNLAGQNPLNNEDHNQDYSASLLVPLKGNQGILVNISDSERNEQLFTESLRAYQVSYFYDFSKRTRAYAGFVFGKTETSIPLFGDRTDYERKLAMGVRHNF